MTGTSTELSALGADLAGQVSTVDAYDVESEGRQRFTVAALDLGIKPNTPRNFARRFHEETGHTPARAIARLRVEFAREKIEASPDPIDRIAASPAL